MAPAQEVQGTEGAPPPARLIGRLPASAPPQRAPSASQAAAAIAQHKLRSIKARRQYQKWSTERQERLRKEAEERAKKEAEERARREAEEKLRKEQEAARQKAEEELTRMKAADADKKRKEQDVAMAAAMEKAKSAIPVEQERTSPARRAARVISLASTSAPALTPASCARACARTLVSLATRTCSVTAPACDV